MSYLSLPAVVFAEALLADFPHFLIGPFLVEFRVFFPTVPGEPAIG
jgi:hypothetical protein